MKKRKLTRHHLTPQCRHKKDYHPIMPTMNDLLYLTEEKHRAWHLLFKEACLEEVIALLIRIQRRRWQ